MKMIQGGTIEMISDQNNMVEAFDGGNKEVLSPAQNSHDTNWEQIQPAVSYNFQTTNLSGIQKIMLYSAFFGIAYIIYKKFKR